jgi:orotate phosphoribosyltransferase
MDIKKKLASCLLEIGVIFLRPDEPFTWPSELRARFIPISRMTLKRSRSVTWWKCFAELIRSQYPDCEVLMGTAPRHCPMGNCGAHPWFTDGLCPPEAKDHGRQNQIEGKLEPGQKVVVVGGFDFHGGSVLEVVNVLRESGAEVLGIVSIYTTGCRRVSTAGLLQTLQIPV